MHDQQAATAQLRVFSLYNRSREWRLVAIENQNSTSNLVKISARIFNGELDTNEFNSSKSVSNLTPRSFRMICDAIPADLDNSSAGLEVLVSLAEIQPLSDVKVEHVSCLGELKSDGLDNCVAENLAAQKNCKDSRGDEPKKKRGGWPKGKKRKADTRNVNIPKAPNTGYVLFLNERRRNYMKIHPDVPFADVTKVLGNEWTNMAAKEKQKYLDGADADKKRYREELATYRKTDYYRTLLKKKQLESRNGPADICTTNQTEFCSELTIDLGTDDESADELYCKICDQLFSSMHNKKEHMYGRQHLQAMTGEMCKASTSCDERWSGSIDAPPDAICVRLTGSTTSGTSGSATSTMAASNVNQAIHDFFEITLGRLDEIRELKCQLAECRKNKDRLLTTMNGLKLLESSLQASLKSLKAEEFGLKDQLENLRMVPALFGVINFQHQT